MSHPREADQLSVTVLNFKELLSTAHLRHTPTTNFQSQLIKFWQRLLENYRPRPPWKPGGGLMIIHDIKDDCYIKSKTTNQ